MGLLSEGQPLDWEEMKEWQEHVRKYGVEQFIRLYNRLKVTVICQLSTVNCHPCTVNLSLSTVMCHLSLSFLTTFNQSLFRMTLGGVSSGGTRWSTS